MTRKNLTSKQREALIVPVLNINGTNRAQLLETYCHAQVHLDEAIRSVRNIGTHGRDYPREPGHWLGARAQLDRWLAALDTVYQEIEIVAERIDAQEGGR